MLTTTVTVTTHALSSEEAFAIKNAVLRASEAHNTAMSLDGLARDLIAAFAVIDAATAAVAARSKA